MSAIGISPAWRADSDGIPTNLIRGFFALNVVCEESTVDIFSIASTVAMLGCTESNVDVRGLPVFVAMLGCEVTTVDIFSIAMTLVLGCMETPPDIDETAMQVDVGCGENTPPDIFDFAMNLSASSAATSS